MAILRYNIFYNVCYQILSLIVPLITAPYISRTVGANGMGLYTYTFSIAHYFVLFCMLGVLNYGNREIAIAEGIKSKSERFWQIFINQFLFGILSMVLYLFFICFYVQNNIIIYAIQMFYIASGILDISWFYFGIEKFKTTTSISALNKIATTVCIFLFVKSSNDVWIYTLIVALGVLLNNVVYWVLLPQYLVKVKVKRKEVLCHLMPLILLFIPVIAINIYKYIDKIMLGAMFSINSVGIFDAAEKLTNIPMGFIAAIGTVMLPRISNLVTEKNESNIRRYNNLSFNAVMFLAVGMSFGLACLSDTFVPFFYGDAFYDSIEVLMFLAPCMLFVSWANVIRTQYLLPYKRDKVFCLSVVLGAIVNIVSNYFLIPTEGSLGAAISTLLAEFTVCSFQSIIVFNKMHLIKPLWFTMPYIINGCIMFFVASKIVMESPLITIICRICVGACIYTILSFFVFKRNVSLSSVV